MLVRLFKYFRGYVKLRVEGYSPERFLNLCNVNRLLLWGVENHGLTYELYVSVRDYKKMRPFARKTGTRIVLLEKHGFPFFLYRFRKRKMFFSGMVLCCMMIYALSLFVWNIHFEGNVTQSNEELLEYLETLGVSHGSLKSGIVCETIETGFRSRYPNMLWVSAEMRGTRIIIQIKENTDADIVSRVELKDTEPVSITADTDGVVESIIVRQGTPAVKQGDEVSAGQILVEGYYMVKNDAGEIVRYEGVPADADIALVKSESYTDSFSAEYEEKVYTGKKRLGIQVCFMEKSMDLQPKIPFPAYDVLTDRKELHITENFYLPFSLELTWYVEYTPETKTYGTEALKKLAGKRYQEKYENILQKGVQIIEKDVRIDTNGKLCHVTGTTVLRIPVTTKIPAVLPETDNETSIEGET